MSLTCSPSIGDLRLVEMLHLFVSMFITCQRIPFPQQDSWSLFLTGQFLAWLMSGMYHFTAIEYRRLPLIFLIVFMICAMGLGTLFLCDRQKKFNSQSPTVVDARTRLLWAIVAVVMLLPAGVAIKFYYDDMMNRSPADADYSQDVAVQLYFNYRILEFISGPYMVLLDFFVKKDDDQGFLSKICLIEADWQGARAGENLPKKFVAKLCTAVTLIVFAKRAMGEEKQMEGLFDQLIQMVRLLENDVKEFHNTEVDVFTLLKKYGLSSALHTPKIYYQQKFTEEEPLKGHIIMDYVEEVAPLQIYDTLPVEALDQPLRALAVLEAASLRFTDEEWKLFKTNPLAQIHKQYFIPGKSDDVVGMLKALGNGKLDKLAEQLHSKLQQILDIGKYDSIASTLGMRSVLCHGDTWTPNILWRKGQMGYKMAAIIQTAHFGNPAGDLGRPFNTSLTGKDRRKHTDFLLKKFYKFITEELRGEPAQLKRSYELYFPMGAYIQLHSVGPLLDLVVRTGNSEEKHIVNSLVFEKTECLLEDLLGHIGK